MKFRMSNLFMVLTAILLQVTPVLAERKTSTVNIPVAKCKEFANSVFKPCICNKKAPASIKYRPALEECGGKAAAILTRGYSNSFSVVLRDKQNRDRWPASGYNGCTKKEVDEGLSKCSAFKCQKVIKTNSSSVYTGKQQICCFGEAGTTKIMRGATRLTIKIRDVPGSNLDPLVRVCLKDFSPLNDLN